jgi:hypothetical protein
MSRQLIAHSPDLQRLQDEGYDFEIRSDQLLLKVPYVTASGTVGHGYLASELTVSGDRTAAPSTHVVHFIGAAVDDAPFDNTGHRLDGLIIQFGPIQLGGELVASCMFSHKPDPTYADYYEKMSTYADMLWAYAQAVMPGVRVRTFPPIPADEEDSVFRYFDSATSRARIGAVTDKVRLGKVVIVGAGGTGSYILDCVAKTPVKEIHVYDGDRMLTHNAFRSPGAASIEELTAVPYKVDYLSAKYDAMRRNVVGHAVYVDASNVAELGNADFVFLSMDAGPAKKLIVQSLQDYGVPFVDTGLGVYQVGDSIGGILRTTASTPGNTQHVWENDRVSFNDEDDDEYGQNIQIAELNMLNAALAVIKWKKMFAFYTDFEGEFSSVYTTDGNHMLNMDQGG